MPAVVTEAGVKMPAAVAVAPAPGRLGGGRATVPHRTGENIALKAAGNIGATRGTVAAEAAGMPLAAVGAHGLGGKLAERTHGETQAAVAAETAGRPADPAERAPLPPPPPDRTEILSSSQCGKSENKYKK